jgi:hypothetical protein
MLAYMRPERRLRVAVVIVSLAAFAATVASGEYRSTWMYLLVDAGLVLVSAAAAFVFVTRMSQTTRL